MLTYQLFFSIQIVKHLEDYVIGQDRAKKILAVAVYNHYCRVRANLETQQQAQQQKEQQQQQQSEERYHVEHHHSTLPQDYYTSNPIQSVGNDLVPAERLSSYGKRKLFYLYISVFFFLSFDFKVCVMI